MNKYLKISFFFYIIFSLNLYSDYEDQRGMTKLLGNETYLRCAKEMSKSNAKVYELSYNRTSSMPLSPFAGEYKPKFLPEIPWAGSRQVFTMDVLNENVNDGNQGTQMDAFGHFAYTDEVWDGKSQIPNEKIKYFVTKRLQLTDEILDLKKLAKINLKFKSPKNYLKILFNISDEIWFLAGDKSLDFNFYSKRFILMNIYLNSEVLILDSKDMMAL